ncbi:hypothetical protein ACMX2H_16015 [Arthrobacter sulfonylureivorans]|uniref:hypothetical protein n=1 Tax=Arthrobacter sulfonylureivorans TaxID=2486855 RepID=UPI0039E2BE60
MSKRRLKAAVERGDIEALAAAVQSVLELHNNVGRRWTGFPRADHLDVYCTHCNMSAPCPTVQGAKDALGAAKQDSERTKK